MRPILFHLGPLPVFSFGFLVACGVLLSLTLMTRRSRKTGFPAGDTAADMVFASVGSGFLGARLYYVLQNLSWYLQHPAQIFAFWEGGLIFYGGVAGAFLGLWIFTKIKKISFAKSLDFILPYVALTHAFGRLGCFMNGCCYGTACELPWAVQFPNFPGPVHPTQIYEAILDLGLFLTLNARYPQKRFDGEIAVLYFIFYAAIRFFIEFFRADNPEWAMWTLNQWASLFVFLTAAGFYLFKRRALKK
jgi:phosphatidylglycerol---prolipoprotein diacylglyceryl transferase